MQQELDDLVERCPPAEGERLAHVVEDDALEAGGRQDAADAIRIGEGEGPRRVGRRRRRQRQVPCGGSERQSEPRVLAERLPADEGEPSTRPKRRAEIREGRRRVGEEHHTEARVEQVELRGREAMGLSIRVLEADVGEAGLPR